LESNEWGWMTIYFIRNNMLGKALGTENGEHGTSLWGMTKFHWEQHMLWKALKRPNE
jgi:hypothetical protein